MARQLFLNLSPIVYNLSPEQALLLIGDDSCLFVLPRMLLLWGL